MVIIARGRASYFDSMPVCLARHDDGKYWWFREGEADTGTLGWDLKMDWPLVHRDKHGNITAGWAIITEILPAATPEEHHELQTARLLIGAKL